MDPVLSNFLGIITGILSSLVTWWLLFHGLVPRIKFSEFISKLPLTENPSKFKYRFKFENVGPRALIDAQIQARLSIKGLQFENSWTVFKLTFNSSGEKKAEIPLISSKHNRVLRFYINSVQGIKESKLLPEEIRLKASNGSILLEDLLILGSSASMTGYVFGYDTFSGARKLFISKKYRINDIRIGRFKEMDIVPKDFSDDSSREDAG